MILNKMVCRDILDTVKKKFDVGNSNGSPKKHHMSNQGVADDQLPGEGGKARAYEIENGMYRAIGHGKRHIGTNDNIRSGELR